MASRRAFEEPEKDVDRLSVGVVPAYESEKADSYGLLGNGNDVVLSVDFRFDILRWALAANPASAPVGVVGDNAGESVSFMYGSITDKGLKSASTTHGTHVMYCLDPPDTVYPLPDSEASDAILLCVPILVILDTDGCRV
jgi:hypothetical protein